MLLLLPPCLVCLLTSSGLINGLSGWCTNTSFLHFSLCLFGFLYGRLLVPTDCTDLTAAACSLHLSV